MAFPHTCHRRFKTMNIRIHSCISVNCWALGWKRKKNCIQSNNHSYGTCEWIAVWLLLYHKISTYLIGIKNTNTYCFILFAILKIRYLILRENPWKTRTTFAQHRRWKSSDKIDWILNVFLCSSLFFFSSVCQQKYQLKWHV